MSQVYDPYEQLAKVPSFEVTSTDMADGQPLSPAQMSDLFSAPGGKDVSPQLSWSGAPRHTKSYAITAYDPDAPTGSGFWHWGVVNIPDSVSELPRNAGQSDGSLLPGHAFHLRNDASLLGYVGAAPDAASGIHRYFFVVHALDVRKLEIPSDATPAYLGWMMDGHTIARGRIVPVAGILGLVEGITGQEYAVISGTEDTVKSPTPINAAGLDLGLG